MLEPRIILVDARNWDSIKESLIFEVSESLLTGFDLETQDDDRHEGLNTFMKVKDGKKSKVAPLIFDIRRTVITGMSWYCKHSETAYYLNLSHADEENRIPWGEAKQILDAKPAKGYWVIHNAPFERTMLKMSLGYELGAKVIDTMQLAVSAWNDDTYDRKDFYDRDLSGMDKLFPAVRKEFAGYRFRDPLTTPQEDLLFKVIAKSTATDHSYNGWVKKMSFGYGLKGLTKKFLNYTQTTFAEVLRGEPYISDQTGEEEYPNHAHMGELTGEEVARYGADDAWCCLELLPKIYDYMHKHSPEAVKTFMTQENPMTQIYSNVWSEGLKVDPKAIYAARDKERIKSAEILRLMKSAIEEMLPFPEEPHEKLMKYDKWYTKNWEKYRQQIIDWVETPDSEDAFEQHHQVRGPISNSWAQEKELKESKGINVLHYMPLRTLLFDLCRFSYIQHEGKTQSNGDARDKMKERWLKKHDELEEYNGEVEDEAAMTFLNSIQGLSDSEQSMKLYLTNYLNLTDPETSRMYPVLNSMLNSRRMALSFPNVSQLPKGSDISYVRGFFKPDHEDHILVSADWSSVELVIIGDLSGDRGFKEAFGQLPYQDLHTKAAAGGLGITVKELKAREDYKLLRRDIGKGSNFNYWYSGALGTVADKMGWSSEEMWLKVEGYRNTFPEAEAWRLETIEEAKFKGEVVLPDHHKRYRFETTDLWSTEMRRKFKTYGKEVAAFGELVMKKVRTRAGNQAVNSKVQGTGSTLAKRSILSMEKVIKVRGYDANFKFPCHDELIYSVHKDDVLSFCRDLRKIMNHHPGIIKNLKLACTVALGNNYWGFDLKDNPYGQIELDELQWNVPGFEEDRWEGVLNEDEIQKVVDYLVSEGEEEETAF